LNLHCCELMSSRREYLLQVSIGPKGVYSHYVDHCMAPGDVGYGICALRYEIYTNTSDPANEGGNENMNLSRPTCQHCFNISVHCSSMFQGVPGKSESSCFVLPLPCFSSFVSLYQPDANNHSIRQHVCHLSPFLSLVLSLSNEFSFYLFGSLDLLDFLSWWGTKGGRGVERTSR
jgi:hypothetical protein